MRRPSIALALLLVAPLATAQVYKWTDAQGTTHFSQSPPPAGTKYSQVSVSGGDEPAAAPAAGDNASSDTANSSTQNNTPPPSAAVPDTPANRAQLCTNLKSSIGTLQGTAPVVMQGPNGQQLLNADQRKQQLNATQSEFQQFCKNG